MKAFLLAAGQGTRLRPYTAAVPKCLIPIHERPLLEIWIDLLERHGVTEVLINTHYLADAVEQFVTQYQPRTAVHLRTAFEPELLGSGGTLWHHRHWVSACQAFLIVYADNLTNADLSQMVAFHKQCRAHDGILTMGLFQAPDPHACGIAVLDPAGRIVKFVEKPARPQSNWANAGIYVASPQIFDYFPPYEETPGHTVLDLGYHVLPRLTGKAFGWQFNGYLRDIGTVASYRQALEEWPAKGSKHES
jgi:mannose-1-phosphate guanylyltransferase